MNDFRIRDARPDDAAQMLAIYTPYVLETAISFELEPPSLEEFSARLRKVQSGWAWLQAEREGKILGYAYAGEFRARLAYRFATETTVYVRAGSHGLGIGKALYAALLPRLRDLGYRRAVAGTTLPNPASVALHKAAGFEEVGIFNKVGFKFDQWHDVAWLQRDL